MTLAKSATRARARRRGHGDGRTALGFLAPVFLGFAVFYLYPAVRGAWYSLTDWNLLSEPRFVGLDNYATLVGDPLFWNSLKVTAYYVVLTVGMQILGGLLLAALLHRLTRSLVLRSLLLVPWLVPSVTTALLWMWLLDANLGFFNHLLTAAGLDNQGFLTSPDLALPSVATINAWSGTGYTALLLYAGMLLVPPQIYEAAAIDGTGEVRTFLSVTLPLIRPILAFALVVSLISSFQLFDTVAVTTKGGPVNATRVIYFYIYEQAFTHFKMGYASALALSLVLVLGALTFVQMRLLRASTSDLT
ncbi:multiple sugar transport system permease protein [Thermocatellispora tengchongensis]|uniref:Multiple sugar transport system permease protein n=1 Tax=Thermocatellispora tengchongensis TaxID=1073253 RepID=A0A840PML3_9ACTN|nr:sugar ABC transporter permease [Thermocatellispora tengchongensis]MBB5138910.1 multiple sugar transport system permease protein [Thermocatellispora tengchongensis]